MEQTYYVDKQEFYQALVEYKAQCDAADPDDLPSVSSYIGQCIMKIAQGMSRRPNFVGYSFRDEMASDAIEVCLKRVRSFDINHPLKNPFGYFSQACWFACIERIKKEKKQTKIKRAMIRLGGVETFSLQGHDDDGEFTLNLTEFLSNIGEDEPMYIPPPKVDGPDPFEGMYE